MAVMILLIFALVCFAIHAFHSGGQINLDAVGKAFLVGALIVSRSLL